jgi:hypothetical protein
MLVQGLLHRDGAVRPTPVVYDFAHAQAVSALLTQFTQKRRNVKLTRFAFDCPSARTQRQQCSTIISAIVRTLRRRSLHDIISRGQCFGGAQTGVEIDA